MATIVFGIVGPLVIRNPHSQRQKATAAHSTAMQSGRDNIIIHGPATFHSKTPDAHSDELRKIAIGTTILLGVISGLYLWDKTYPLELQQTILLDIAFSIYYNIVSYSAYSLDIGIYENALLNKC